MSNDQPSDPGDWAHEAPPNTLPFPVSPRPLPPKWSAPAADAPLSDIWRRLNPERISCVGTSCADQLHCFRLTKQLAKKIGPGTCRVCKKPLVEIGRIARKSLDDIDYTFSALQLEYVRHYFWHVQFNERIMGHARRAAGRGLTVAIEAQIKRQIADAEPYRDGRQTPTAPNKANAFDYAMHAVAACCRQCAEYWHGIPKGRALTEEEISYLAELMRLYLITRMPELGEYRPSPDPPAARQSNVHTLPAHADRATEAAVAVLPRSNAS
jgi:Domain of unknown function (DUF4186)